MKPKNTSDLQRELTSAPDLSRFLSENREEFIDHSFSQQLAELFQRSGLTKAALAKRASISEVYLYQIFAGNRLPSRDRTLCLCIALGAQLEETQELLRRSGYAQLYVKDRRDAIILYGVDRSMGLHEINDKLFAENEATLC